MMELHDMEEHFKQFRVWHLDVFSDNAFYRQKLSPLKKIVECDGKESKMFQSYQSGF